MHTRTGHSPPRNNSNLLLLSFCGLSPCIDKQQILQIFRGKNILVKQESSIFSEKDRGWGTLQHKLGVIFSVQYTSKTSSLCVMG